MLDAKGERTVAEVCDKLRSALGDKLVAVALYGSAAGSDWVAGKSDINIVAVVDSLGYEDLRAVRQHVAAWRKKRVATPLLLDRRFLRSAVDVFPMELYDIREGHRLLFGEDVFSTLSINDEHLRYQCENEARGKLLRLRELYLEIGADRRRLRTLMLDSLTTFLTIMRHLTRRDALLPPRPYADVVRTFRSLFHRDLPVTERLLEMKQSKAAWTGDEEETFRGYLSEIEQFVATIDELNVPAGDAASTSRRP
jgi:predicted nucleotidyltransferase